jgi:AraC-like DNA-binding protein
MARLLNPLEEAVLLAETTPGKLSHLEVVRALEQTLIHAMVKCLTTGKVQETSVGNRRHSAAIARLEQFLESNHDRPLYIAEVCAACGVSERTLRASCQDHLGMSPVRYLWLRRMHLAHRMLLKSDPTKTTVTEIATEHGFWELGRFSVQYRALFGELPSATLRRANSDRECTQNRPSVLPIPNLHS